MGDHFNPSTPNFDSLIEDAKDSIEQKLYDLLEEACPMLPTDKVRDIASDYAYDLCSDLDRDLFDSITETISDIIYDADDLIGEQKGQIKDLEDEVIDLKNELRTV